MSVSPYPQIYNELVGKCVEIENAVSNWGRLNLSDELMSKGTSISEESSRYRNQSPSRFTISSLNSVMQSLEARWQKLCGLKQTEESQRTQVINLNIPHF